MEMTGIGCGAVGGIYLSRILDILSYNINVDNLNIQVETLEQTKGTLRQRVDTAEQNGEKIFDHVKYWLAKADGIIHEARRFQDDEGHTRVGCLNGLFPNLFRRSVLSWKAKQIAKEISDVIKQVDEAIKMDKISYRPTLTVGVSPSSRGYKTLDSRTSILNEIMQALNDPNIHKIGLCGMSGVGKTTLVKELAWKAEQDSLFGKVVVATVSISPDVKDIQGQLADVLGLKFQEETQGGRAHRLRERIKTENNILVILDDIWKKLDLTEIGIPFSDDHQGCKLLLTSRDLSVLKYMDTDKEFKLEVLMEDESWVLFEKTAGDVVGDNNIKPTALEIAHSCAGLPFLIVTVATALKRINDLSIWKEALNKLTTFDRESLKSQMYAATELSYNHFQTQELKSFFLFLASIGNGQTPT